MVWIGKHEAEIAVRIFTHCGRDCDVLPSQVIAELAQIAGFKRDVVEAVFRFSFESRLDFDVLAIIHFEATWRQFRETEAGSVKCAFGRGIVGFEGDVRHADDGRAADGVARQKRERRQKDEGRRVMNWTEHFQIVLQLRVMRRS
jgi:hypothetical protein